ncbi:MAG: methionine adenosyltransferase [Bacteroidales bacterium]|jgi:S-adenosylmethionine synthetase|nr:methionine adenosyltransferase [Bacteroidales bacterium]
MSRFITSESVSEGHPDKMADQISDAILDEFLRRDKNSKVACETLTTTGLVFLSGEISSEAFVDVQSKARQVIREIGYTKEEYKFAADSCAVISTIHEQSPDINQGVVRDKPLEQGAGDQGMMFGYANKDTEDFMPLPIVLAHQLVHELAQIRKEKKQMKYLRPDSKSQVTIEYDDNNKPVAVNTIVVSTQHDEDVDVKQIEQDIRKILIPRVIALQKCDKTKDLFKADYKLFVNPTGKFVIGGPNGDTGLTGRKIIVDTYGGRGSHGGGAFSGKDSSKVDRSAAYAVRHVAKNMVAAGVCDEVSVQVAYAIGVAQPVGLFVDTYNTSHVKDKKGNIMSDGEIAEKILKLFDLRPYSIIKRFGLKNPIFRPTASYGHFGRTPYKKQVEFIENNKSIMKEVEFYTWEKLDYVDKIKKEFAL